MNRLYYILCATAVLSACQKQELEPQGGLDVDRLEFNTSIDGVPVAQSRAASVDTDLTTTGFYLAGYHTEGLMAAAAATAYPNVFDKEVADQQSAVPQVSYTGSKFTLKTIKWLLDDVSYLSFYGWSQSKAFATTVDASTTGIIGQTKDGKDKGYPWIEIRNADAPLDQTDVVGSRSIDHKNDAVISAVDLDFRHLLSKLTFKAKSSSKANITITAVNIKYAASKVRKKARYIFGSETSVIGEYGSYSEYQSGTAPLKSSYPSITGGAEVVLGSALLVPQELQTGDVSIELKYKLSPNSGDIAGPEQTKTLPLSALTFEQGNNYVYAIDIQATGILIAGNPTIEEWSVVSYTNLPLVPGPKGDVLLLLDGYDKPYHHTDGKWYWIDRSGYNRHVELVGYYDGMHNASDHYYSFTNSGNVYAKVPDFPRITALHADVIAQETGSDLTNQTLLDFHPLNTQLRQFFQHMGYKMDGILYFDVGNPGASNIRLTYNTKSTTYFRTKGMWSFFKVDDTIQRIYENARLKAESTKVGNIPLGTLNDNYIGRYYSGNVSYVKMTSAERPVLDIVTDYQAQAKRHNIVEQSSSYLPPVTEGMVFCYDGRSGVETINGVSYWRDQVSRNDARLIGNVSYANNGFSVTATDYLRMMYNVAMTNDFTIEIVLQPNKRDSGFPIYWIDDPTTGSSGRVISLHFPYASGGTIFVDAPGGADRYNSSGWPSGFGGETDKRHIAIRRNFTGGKSEFFMYDRVALTSGKAPSVDISSRVCTEMNYGGTHGGSSWSGSIYSVRLYNRVLTDSEMTQNYQFNKKAYGFTD